jgi:hypothetical protein
LNNFIKSGKCIKEEGKNNLCVGNNQRIVHHLLCLCCPIL